jgi:putative nucleotidyltransferase with HDIG domain/PAS domain S-box-containing protein
MNREEFLYLVPYIISLALSLGVFIYTWQHRHVRGAGAYAWFVAGQTLSVFAFIMELISLDLDTKILWDKFQWVTETSIIVVAYFVFAIQFTEMKIQRPAIFWTILLSIPSAFNILLITDGIHHLIYPNPHLTETYPFRDLEYDFTIAVYILSVYIYGVSLYGIGLLVSRIFRPHNLYRSQLATMAMGFLIPVVLSVFSLLDIRISPQRDIFPFSAALGNLIVAFGLFRFRLFEIVPIARERVIENMTDPVIVVDALDRVVDINQIALDNIEKKASQVIGQPSAVVFSQWGELQEQFRSVEQQNNMEVTARIKGAELIYDIGVFPIHDNRKRTVGRVFVARDITRRKTLEIGYRQLSEELEQRVQERTEELAEAYDTTLEGWAHALELRDKETEDHSRRVTEATLKVARAVGFNEEQLVQVRRGAILHDIGKIGIPDEILRKPDVLTDEERKIVMEHPKFAYNLLYRIPHIKDALDIPYCHHEKWDGSGYPRGLHGEDIPLSARIFAVVDVWDALSADRPYRKAWSDEKIVEHLKSESGKYFDPKVVTLFLDMLKKGGI